MNFPKLYKVKQFFDTQEIKDVYQKIHEELLRIGIADSIAGKKIGITAGSRGIKNIDKMYKALVDFISSNGGTPYLIATMGSHGGGTLEGQLGVLKELNVTEESMGCPIIGSIVADNLGTTPDGIPVFVNEKIKEVDQIIVINRIKPHTDFTAVIESGLHKMLTIGLGTLDGAESAHISVLKHGYFHTITEIGKVLNKHLNVLCGVGIVENALGKTHTIEAIKSEDLWEREVALLEVARENFPQIPFNYLDVLLIREIGKNISGAGMDSKVIGRMRTLGLAEPEFPQITRISVFGVTPESHGNYIGLGISDFTTLKVFDQCNNRKGIRSAVLNSVISMGPAHAGFPCMLEDEKEMVEQSLKTIGVIPPEEAKLVFIKNTKDLDELYISEALVEEAKKNPNLEVSDEFYEFKFDENNDMIVPKF